MISPFWKIKNLDQILCQRVEKPNHIRGILNNCRIHKIEEKRSGINQIMNEMCENMNVEFENTGKRFILYLMEVGSEIKFFCIECNNEDANKRVADTEGMTFKKATL